MVNYIRLFDVVEEDFLNYKKPSMFLITFECDFKCCKEQGLDISICQNYSLLENQVHDFKISSIYEKYKSNDISKSIVIGGMEPFLQFEEVYSLIEYFRNKNCLDDFVIYTGYYKNEIEEKIDRLKKFTNIIIKFGRFIPNDKFHFDPILGINLVSKNQYAEKIT